MYPVLLSGSLSGSVLIAISGYGGSEIEQRSKEAGIDLHLLKPVDMGELQQLLSRLAGS
jgi:hypothetical protein